ncbi:hypothetical protein MA20_45415 [Bradyrhizobium japonicum]|uniref:Peptidase C45 hydrolase domain-containing protein n=1 Tax=Bradyrhizobium japonicum TaxID=375 RepID=A0A0A3XIZ4_BRAJP|nr:C45 family peptidase [Bradyrhizobium japonicum]KGT73244.1 hypothetical protein MA20_45415 [Bradyrhizobium japonicum]
MSLRLIRFERTPRERGRQHGEIMRSEIATRAEVYLNRFRDFGIDLVAVQAEAKRWHSFLGQISANYVEELRGISEAANLPIETITMLNIRYEIGVRLLARTAIDLSNAIDGCTSAGLMPEATSQGAVVLAQTIDGPAPVSGTMFVGKIPEDQNSWLGVFEAGCVGPTAGLNEAGIGLVCNGLLTAIDGVGPMFPPYKVRTRAILETRRFDRAIQAIIRQDRNSSMNYLVGHSDGEIISIETSPNSKRYLFPENGVVTHANHFEPGGHIVSEFERFVPSSVYRSRRLERHLRSKLANIDVDHVWAGLRDHFSYPASICLHPEKDAPGAQSSTIVAIVMDLKRLVLFATDGPPCGAPVQTFDLAA